MDLTTLIGIIGVVILLVSFISVTLKKITPSSFIYKWLNFIGSLTLIIYSLMIYAWPILVLNAIWSIFAIAELICQQ